MRPQSLAAAVCALLLAAAPAFAASFTAGERHLTTSSSSAAVRNHGNPVIRVSHGFGGSARSMAWFGTALARAGYLVVAVDHPGTNGADGVTAEGAYAPWER